MPGQFFGGIDRVSRHIAGTARQLSLMRLIRKEAARLFAEYGVGAVGIFRVADALRLSDSAVRRCYASRRDLLIDVLNEHLAGLNEAIGAAFDAQPPGTARLEAVVAAWLDHVGVEPNEHRTLLFSAHLLPPEQREAVSLKHRILLETAFLALSDAMPGLADRRDLAGPLLGMMAVLLGDPAGWPEPEPPEIRRRRARRITGMMLAVASAELAGAWPTIGTTEGPPEGRHVIECSQARARFKELLDAVAAGSEVTITRHGRPAIRVLKAG